MNAYHYSDPPRDVHHLHSLVQDSLDYVLLPEPEVLLSFSCKINLFFFLEVRRKSRQFYMLDFCCDKTHKKAKYFNLQL